MATDPAVIDPLEASYALRRLTPEYATEIPALATRVNGPSYIHAEVYNPDRLLELNAAGELVSVVALDKAGEVVGHCALERPHLTVVAETGEAMVLLEHRHHHLLDRMHGYLEGIASALGVLGLSSDAVTNHVYSQRTCERFNSHPTGIILGALPPSADNLENVYPQRLSFLDYFKYVTSPSEADVYLPEHYHGIAGRILERLGRKASFGAPARLTKPGKHSVAHVADEQRANVAVQEPGTDTAEAIAAARDELCGKSGAEVVIVELPLAHSATSMVCEQLERRGFFFTGLKMRDPAVGDIVRLQYLKHPLDFSFIKLDGEFAIEILHQIDNARRRAIVSA